VSALFQVKLIDTNGIDPYEAVGDSSESPERRRTVRRDWQYVVLWAEKDSLA
jgi:hypothetical protein